MLSASLNKTFLSLSVQTDTNILQLQNRFGWWTVHLYCTVLYMMQLPCIRFHCTLLVRWVCKSLAMDIQSLYFRIVEGREGVNVLFNNTLNTCYLQLYGIGYMVKDHSDSERGNPLLPHGLLFPIHSKVIEWFHLWVLF